MQVMPQIASHYGVHDLTDPESNIKAGTMILQKLQREWIKRDLEGEELLNFILASYNAGKGKIIDYRNFALQEGSDPDRWEEIVKIAPIMREQGLFLSSETIAYVEKVLTTYEAYCQSHPEC
jgi:membrane-bound lytic murein transglycosylase F